MELELVLALPSSPIKGLDLNFNVYEPKKALALASSNPANDNNIKKKRSFDETFEHYNYRVVPIAPRPLFWNNQPNEEDNSSSLEKNPSSIINKDDEDGVVGWPPIKSWRKKFMYYSHGVENGRVGGGGGRGWSMYVKVNMEGIGITRKIDLSLHNSYQTLTATLITMFAFGKYTGQQNVGFYELTYQDMEGDWLLAGDVPWLTFIRSVQRLKLVKRGG